MERDLYFTLTVEAWTLGVSAFTFLCGLTIGLLWRGSRRSEEKP